MLPTITVFPGVQVWTWGVFHFLAALAILFVGMYESRRRDIPWRAVWDLWPLMVAGILVGGHILWLLTVPRLSELSFLGFVNVFRGGSVLGGVAGGTLALYLFLRSRKLPILRTLDVLSPGIGLSHGIARLGCFCAGCCFGKPTDLPWGVVFTHPAARNTPLGVPLHPAQLYEAALDALLALLLHRQLAGRRGDGWVFGMYLGGYGLIRFLVQFMRYEEPNNMFLGLAHAQYLSIIMVFFSIWLMRRAGAKVS